MKLVGHLWKWLKHSIVLCGAIAVIWFYFSLPTDLFDKPTATVLFDARDQLLGATIAADHQWRFPAMDSLPQKFITALIGFEDQYFYRHPGINPGAIFRAIKQNWKAGKVVSGASTLSMQVIRMSRDGRPRSIREKLIEMVLALRLELRYTKEEILQLYATNAPFGGNTVGLETAAWRYYGTSPHQLSWGEAATLAVLPNQPSLIYPGRHDSLLINKRNRLLKRLSEAGQFDEMTLGLAIAENIPDPPGPLPQLASHYLASVKSNGNSGTRITTSISKEIQEKTTSVLARHHQSLALDQIHNAAILVAEVKTGKVLAYLGNSPTTSEHQNQVDIIQARRSPGSTLKPFLFAAALDESLILPRSLLPDIPIYFQGFTPKNFALDYDGAVPANEALVRSLNIPFVQLLHKYSYPKFNLLLQDVGFTSLDKHPDHYGLSIILGGAEVSLFELANGYLQLNQKRLGFQKLMPMTLRGANSLRSAEHFPLSREACWHTSETLLEVDRPGDEGGWRSFQNARQISWKTGTSFGFKDAWAVGMTTKYLVAVWVGNADGEGRPNIIGSKVAAPILFDVFNQFGHENSSNGQPTSLRLVETCRQSGHRAGEYCPESVMDKLLAASDKHPICPYHERVFINDAGERVLRQCAKTENIEERSAFLLPPSMAKYYAYKHRDYAGLPTWSASCKDRPSQNLAWIYPAINVDLLIPQEIDGSSGRVIFELAHQVPQQKVHWHLDNAYLGHTTHDHKLAAWVPQGEHELVVVDETGEKLVKRINVLGE